MNDYNFLSDYENQRKININIKSPITFSAIVVIILLLISTGFIVRNMILASEVSHSNDKLSGIKATQDYLESTRLQDSITAMSEYDSSADVALKAFNSSSVLGTPFLKKLAVSIPSVAKFTKINLTSAKLEMYADVPDRKVAAELLLDLKNSALFQDVQLVSITLKSVAPGYTPGYTVNLSAILKAGGINE